MSPNVCAMLFMSFEGLFISIMQRRLSQWGIVLPATSHNSSLYWATSHSGHHIHLIIKIHISYNVSVMGQRREQWPSIEPTLGV